MDEKKLLAALNEDISDIDLYVYKKTVENFNDKLRELFEYYLENSEYPDFNYRGWSFKAVEEHTHYDFFRVYKEMNHLMTDDKYFELFPYMTFGEK